MIAFKLQAIKMQSDFEEQKLLAEQRLAELEKLTENYKGSLEEIEKRKMEVSSSTRFEIKSSVKSFVYYYSISNQLYIYCF